jgi:tetratricopeptide (TPR) repeat protein
VDPTNSTNGTHATTQYRTDYRTESGSDVHLMLPIFQIRPSHRAVRLVIAVLAIVGCVWLIWITGRLSFSRILTGYAIGVGSLAAADESLRFSASDSEAHFARAIALRRSGALTQALPEFQQAVALRPRDYVPWLHLGLARDENNDSEGALSAFNESVRLAPYYAQPRWQRGNLLLRMRRYDEAFADLRYAAQSNPDFIPSLIDLSWSLSRSDTKLAEQLGGITTPGMQIAFARYLARQGKAREALEQFKAAGPADDEIKQELVSQLIAIKAFAEAFQIWRGSEVSGFSEVQIYDGGFEAPLSLDESGFGWRVPRDFKGAVLSFDTSQKHTGSKCLLVEFTGDSTPESAVVSQLLVVEPAKTYRLSFAVRTKDIVTGGLPFVAVTDAVDRKRLGQSPLLPQGTSEWQTLDFSFTTGAATTGVVLSLQRQNCTTSPCPAFGTVWLDSFGIRRAKH